MPEKKYQITWVTKESQPKVGTECPKCGHDTLVRSKFPEDYPPDEKDVYCPTCKWKWRISKSKMTGTERILREHDQGEALKMGQKIIVENQQSMLALLKKIYEKLQ